jgi:glycogen(starch) synthase
VWPVGATPFGVRPAHDPMTFPERRLVIVVRADPVICGHSGEARNLAEVALTRGFDDVRLLTWPIATLEAAGLPLKPMDRLQPYGPGITVERPEPVGDYRVPDGRGLAGLTGRLVELLAEPVPTTVLSMYLAPHANVVMDAVTAAHAAGLLGDVHTIAKAVGSDVTNVIRSCLREERFGAAVALLTTFLGHDEVVAVSEYTRDQIVLAAEAVDAHCGTLFAQRCRARVTVSYPPIDAGAYLDLDAAAVDAALHRRGLERDGYVLFLSRVTRAKGIHDLVSAYAASRARDRVKLVVAGTGPALAEVRALAAGDDRVVFLTDVDDDEKPLLMRGCATYEAGAGLRRDVRHRAHREAARRRRPGDHRDHRRHRRGRRRRGRHRAGGGRPGADGGPGPGRAGDVGARAALAGTARPRARAVLRPRPGLRRPVPQRAADAARRAVAQPPGAQLASGRGAVYGLSLSARMNCSKRGSSGVSRASRWPQACSEIGLSSPG